MEEEENATNEHLLNSNDLAFERTLLAENRTLMAWVRTAISLISFGFTIYKFFHETIGNADRFFSPRKVGMLMIGVGVLALIWGLMDHNAVIKKLRKSYPGVRRSKSAWLAVIILLFGLLLFVVALLRQ